MPGETDYRELGNQMFRDKNFSGAITMYTLGINQLKSGEVPKDDDRLALLLNNRAACNLSLSKFSEAQQDAQQSLNVKVTPKAHDRKGRALMGLNKVEEAKMAFERASELEPSNETYREDLERARALSRGGGAGANNATSNNSGGDAGGGMLAPSNAIFVLDLATITSSLVHFITIFFAPSIAFMLWNFALITFGARQAIGMKTTNVIPALNTQFFSNLTTGFHGQYLAVCLILLIGRCPPVHLILVAASIYSLFDLLDNYNSKFNQTIESLPGFVRNQIAPRIERARSRETRQYLMLNATACEIMSIFFVLIVGGGFLMAMVLFQFVKWRYQTDAFVKQVFASAHFSILQLTQHRYCPTAVRPLYEKFSTMLHGYATAGTA